MLITSIYPNSSPIPDNTKLPTLNLTLTWQIVHLKVIVIPSCHQYLDQAELYNVVNMQAISFPFLCHYYGRRRQGYYILPLNFLFRQHRRKTSHGISIKLCQ